MSSQQFSIEPFLGAWDFDAKASQTAALYRTQSV